MSQRQMQELDEERMAEALAVLHRVEGSQEDLLYLARELGVSKQFNQDQQRKAA